MEGRFNGRLFELGVWEGLYLEGLIHGGAFFQNFTVLNLSRTVQISSMLIPSSQEFLSGCVYMCVCGGAGREKESTGYKQTFKGRLETRKACVCCVLEISGFETTTIQTCTSLSWTLCCRFLDQKASLMTKS